MSTPSNQTRELLSDAASRHGFGPVEAVEHVDDGGTAAMKIGVGIAAVVIGIIGLLLVAVVSGGGLLFWGIGLFCIGAILGGPFLVVEGVIKAIRGEVFMGFAGTGAVAVREKQRQVMAYPYDSTQIKVTRHLDKKERCTSLDGVITSPVGKKLKLNAQGKDKADAFNAVVTRFPGQPVRTIDR